MEDEKVPVPEGGDKSSAEDTGKLKHDEKPSALKEKRTVNTIREHSANSDVLINADEASVLKFSENPDESKISEKYKTAEEKKLARLITQDEKKIENLEKKIEKAEKKIPSRKVIKAEKKFNPEKGKVQTKLRLENEVKPVRSGIVSKGGKKVRNVLDTYVAGTLHNEFSKYEDENQTLRAAHATEKLMESSVREAELLFKKQMEKCRYAPHQKVSKLKFQKEKAETRLSYHRLEFENPELRKKREFREAVKKSQQKKNQMKNAVKARNNAVKVKEFAEFAERRIVHAISSSKWGILIVVMFIAIFAVFSSFFTSCAASFTNNSAVYIATSFVSDNSDIYAANNHMNDRESGLRYSVDHIRDWYIGWNEYRYYIDYIGHDPYELIAYLSAMKPGFKYDSEIEEMINQVYDEMYHMETEDVCEERKHTTEKTNPDGSKGTIETTEYYYILNVRVTRKNFEEVVKPKLQARGVYDLYCALRDSKGNRSNLF